MYSILWVVMEEPKSGTVPRSHRRSGTSCLTTLFTVFPAQPLNVAILVETARYNRPKVCSCGSFGHLFRCRCLLVHGRQRGPLNSTSSDPIADTVPATLHQIGAGASAEWTAMADLDVMTATLTRKQSLTVGTEMTRAALQNATRDVVFGEKKL